MKFLYKLTDISNIKRISFRQDINGLRAIAVLVVVFYHADIEILGVWHLLNLSISVISTIN